MFTDKDTALIVSNTNYKTFFETSVRIKTLFPSGERICLPISSCILSPTAISQILQNFHFRALSTNDCLNRWVHALSSTLCAGTWAPCIIRSNCSLYLNLHSRYQIGILLAHLFWKQLFSCYTMELLFIRPWMPYIPDVVMGLS